jgi:DNA mismatch repair ATPase MutS
MTVNLLHRDGDFALDLSPFPNEDDLMRDFDLGILFGAMARGDKYLATTARRAMLRSPVDLDTVAYRQAVLRDCLKNSASVRELYALAVNAVEDREKVWYRIWTHSHPGSMLYNAVRIIEIDIPALERIRKIAEGAPGLFASEGFNNFFAMARQELSEEYFGSIQEHIAYLRSGASVMVGARLGRGLETVGHSIRKPEDFSKGWLQKFFGRRAPSCSFSIHPRDEAGGRALEDFKDRGINIAADALARSVDHIEGFFNLLRLELSFYVGCLNLHERLSELGEPTCFPTPSPRGALRNEAKGIYNACLALHAGKKAVGNDVMAAGRNPILVTGVNEGGKSTLLRSLGVAQLMMQCGMFVPAESFAADMCASVFTHFRRKEDREMKSGKFDEELARMETISDLLEPGSMILFNESFAATNEREGAEIARQITEALVQSGIRVVFVTHLYPFAMALAEAKDCRPLFLRADRQADGSRSFRLAEGMPAAKSHGEDLYRKIFGEK